MDIQNKIQREIKFRAWDKLANRMLSWEELSKIGLNQYFNHPHHYEMLQYTGLHDKNDKEIWEGDIVKFHDLGADMDFDAAPIVFNSCCFRADTLIGFRALHDRVMEVIGNIYETPELLGVIMNTSGNHFRTLKPLISRNSWSYIVNENENALRIILVGYGSCTPIDILQEYIDGLSTIDFDRLWNDCEQTKDTID